MSDTHVDFLMDRLSKEEQLNQALEKENKILHEMNDFLKQLAREHGWLQDDDAPVKGEVRAINHVDHVWMGDRWKSLQEFIEEKAE